MALDDKERFFCENAGEFYSKLNIKFEEKKDEETEEKDKKPVTPSGNMIEETLKKTLSENIAIGDDKVTIDYNGFVLFDGRSHNAVGTDAAGNAGSVKETAKKTFDVKVKVVWNGEVMDPSKYTIKTKNNKAASVSIDGITQIITDQKKLPVYTIKFKGKELKAANDTFKNKEFHFGIIPAEITKDNVEFKTKKDKSGKLKLKKVMFKRASQGAALKPLKLKFSKKEAKTDYIFTENPDGSITVTGKNNYYGSVNCKP